MEEKQVLRHKMLAKRQTWLPEEKKQAEIKMLARLCALKEYQSANMIFCYVGMAEELDTKYFITHFLLDNKRVCVPKVINKTEMAAYEISSFEELAPGVMGILEPVSQQLIAPQEIDLGIIPCVTADRNGYRLGYGGGYYDRYLEKSQMYKVLCLWSALLVENVPLEAHDQPVDQIITEK